MRGLWGMGQMMFTKYIVVGDDDVDVHNTCEIPFRLCANTDPQRACPPRPWPRRIKIDAAVKAKADKLTGSVR